MAIWGHRSRCDHTPGLLGTERPGYCEIWTGPPPSTAITAEMFGYSIGLVVSLNLS